LSKLVNRNWNYHDFVVKALMGNAEIKKELAELLTKEYQRLGSALQTQLYRKLPRLLE